MGHFDPTRGFSFVRFSPYGPSDQEINDRIRYLDPDNHYQALHRHWRDRMLLDRDIYRGLYVRHRRTHFGRNSTSSLPIAEPASWTFSRRTQIVTHFSEAGNSWSGVTRERDCIFLGPAGRPDPSPVHLLSTEMMTGRVMPWSPDFLRLSGHLEVSLGQVEWTRYVLSHMSDLLRHVHLYEGIFLSLFDYPHDPILFRAFATNWNYITNTLFLADREMTITIWEIFQLTGLPIFGRPYEEWVPPDADLFGIRSNGQPRYPDSLRQMYDIYYGIAATHPRDGFHPMVSFRNWIRFFMNRVLTESSGNSRHGSFANPADPFGIGRAIVSVDATGSVPDFERLSSRVLDDETILTAFLAWWLCHFAVVSRPTGYIRPGVFVMANALARGIRVSLAIPALATLYRSLREVTTSRDPSASHVAVPFHLINGWLYAYWRDFHGVVMPTDLTRRLPFLAHLAGASVFPPDQIRTHFLFWWRGRAATHTCPRVFVRGLPTSFGEGIFVRDDPLVSRDDWPILMAFMVSFREGFLPHRQDDEIFAEPYCPQRVAWQFGFDQGIPSLSIPLRPPRVSLTSFSEYWLFILRTGTGIGFFVPHPSRIGHVTVQYLQWYRDLVGAHHSLSEGDLRRCPYDDWFVLVGSARPRGGFFHHP
ncbi:hypothetical protein LUZ63_007478 [Rhynchospora breviuscula]|uniref:Aminotransferase-like plant mobile domain-containing protein n=1 Tax=Rhynchospora breviuscula TaxID=2022672 RepID=A0A9Q0HUK9_9POAL|nr:hypothetical protein LUZ63_007478 [Rhynchospora breviuscula]